MADHREVISAGPLASRYWPPLPKGRRPRALERARRARVVWAHRKQLRDLMFLRARALARELLAGLPPQPPHGLRCTGFPGCPECRAIMSWRDDLARQLGSSGWTWVPELLP